MKRKIVLPVAVVLGLMTIGHLSVDANTKEVFNTSNNNGVVNAKSLVAEEKHLDELSTKEDLSVGAQKLIQSFKHANTFTVQRYSNSIENLNSNKEVIRHISMEFDSENIGKLPNIEDIYNLLIADKSENETVFFIKEVLEGDYTKDKMYQIQLNKKDTNCLLIQITSNDGTPLLRCENLSYNVKEKKNLELSDEEFYLNNVKVNNDKTPISETIEYTKSYDGSYQKKIMKVNGAYSDSEFQSGAFSKRIKQTITSESNNVSTLKEIGLKEIEGLLKTNPEESITVIVKGAGVEIKTIAQQDSDEVYSVRTTISNIESESIEFERDDYDCRSNEVKPTKIKYKKEDFSMSLMRELDYRKISVKEGNISLLCNIYNSKYSPERYAIATIEKGNFKQALDRANTIAESYMRYYSNRPVKIKVESDDAYINMDLKPMNNNLSKMYYSLYTTATVKDGREVLFNEKVYNQAFKKIKNVKKRYSANETFEVDSRVVSTEKGYMENLYVNLKNKKGTTFKVYSVGKSIDHV